VIDKLIKVR